MANPTGKSKKRRLRYFFAKVDDQLHCHRVLHVDKPQDLVTAWDYVEAKRKVYPWSAVRKTMQNAYTVTEVADILGLHRLTIIRYMTEGIIRTPARIYNIGTRTPTMYMFSEDDVMDVHQALSERHQGRPRKDGLVTNNKLPPRSVVRTLVQQGDVLYTKDSDGNFVPVWKEQVW